jgi:hypothetical protein
MSAAPPPPTGRFSSSTVSRRQPMFSCSAARRQRLTLATLFLREQPLKQVPSEAQLVDPSAPPPLTRAPPRRCSTATEILFQ